MGWDYPQTGGGGGSSTPLGAAFFVNATDTTTYTTSSTSAVDVDATNLAVTFTAPANGIVIVTLSALVDNNASGNGLSFVVREGVTNVSTAQVCSIPSGLPSNTSTRLFRITGLTAGSHTYKFGWFTGGGTAQMFTGPTFGSAGIVVQAGV